MLGYWLLIGIPVLLSFMVSQKRKAPTLALVAVGLFYLLFIGLRYEVGADRWAYDRMYRAIAGLPLNEALSYTELGYAALNWLLAQMDGGMYWVNFIAAVFFVSGIIRFAKTTPNPWLALVSVTPYLVIAIALSATRQSAAIGLVFHLMASWRHSLIKKLLLSALAISFHYSAIMSVIFVQQSIKMPAWVRTGILMVGAVAMYPILNATEAYEKYHQTYIEDNIVSSGALMHALLNAVPAVIYFVNQRQWKAKFGHSDLLPMLAVLSVLSLLGVSVSSTGVDRLALYLSPIQMMVYGSLPYLYGRQQTQAVSLGIIAYHLTIMFWWLNYANTSEGFVPYNNLITNGLLG
jgi:hypothetical protein